jgi:hypothetical protein
MSRRLSFGALGLLVLLAACGGGGPPAAQPVSISFLPQTVDFVDDVGYSPSIALDTKGDPFLSYLGFTHILTKAEKKAGVVPASRPVTAPRLPAVLVADQINGIWNRGAAVQSSKLATGPKVDIRKTDQTATAVDSSGVQHVVWTQPNGLYYSDDSSGSFPTSPTKVTGGAVSGPSIAVDPSGTPWVAFYEGTSVKAASLHGKSWSTQTVAKVGRCGSCPQPRTAIQIGSSGPVIAYTDSGRGMLATQSGKRWSTTALAKSGGIGIAMALDSHGTAFVSYFDGTFVTVATASGNRVTLARVGHLSSANPRKDLAGGTAIAVDAKGNQYVAWADPQKGVRLARSTGSGFHIIRTEGTGGGTTPSITATPGGKVELAWFEPKEADLWMGTYPQKSVGAYAVPSPSATVAPPTGGGGGGCPKGVALSVTAPVGAVTSGFSTKQLNAPANKPVDVCFANNDTGVQHNFAVFSADPTKQPSAKNFATGNPLTGPSSEVVKVPALAPGSYFYRCDFHPTTMTGTLTVK